MFSDKTSHIDDNTIELLENAQNRIRQKRNVYRHFIFFLFISGFILFINLVLSVGENLIVFRLFLVYLGCINLVFYLGVPLV
ncbi:MAG: 2TM domain-containing protein [Flavobacteriaceae bacterium]